MSFGTVFDGYCVRHLPEDTEREKWFRQQLKNAGVKDYTVIKARQIDDKDPMIEYFKDKGIKSIIKKAICEAKRQNWKTLITQLFKQERDIKAVLSTADSMKESIEYAKKQKWKNVMIFEDDILFRDEFKTMWSEVEDEVKKTDWDILFLYRWAIPLLEEPKTKTTLIPIKNTACAHAVAIKEKAYTTYQQAIDYCLTKGKAIDTISTFEHLNKKNTKIYATSKNLAGQQSGFESATVGDVRKDTFEEKFRVKKAY